jgi:acetyl esterase/lipase
MLNRLQGDAIHLRKRRSPCSRLVPACRVVVFGLLMSVILLVLPGAFIMAAEPNEVIKLWPGTPPGPAREVGEERDTTKPEDNLVGGRRIIKLANVSVPEAHVYLPPADQRTGASVVICPGGGFHILAWDLEGTEVAEWLNSVGVTAIVLKYRVPTSQIEPKWLQPVQDAQRTISIVRSRAKEWGLNAEQVGVLGFSAGGHTAARTALTTERLYEAVDDADNQSFLPNASVLVYPAYLSNKDNTKLPEGLAVTKDSPPTFIVHAFDDPIPVQGSLLLTMALKNANVPSELHVYDTGGHGYGLRPVDSKPVTMWPERCEVWLKRIGWMK